MWEAARTLGEPSNRQDKLDKNREGLVQLEASDKQKLEASLNMNTVESANLKRVMAGGRKESAGVEISDQRAHHGVFKAQNLINTGSVINTGKKEGDKAVSEQAKNFASKLTETIEKSMTPSSGRSSTKRGQNLQKKGVVGTSTSTKGILIKQRNSNAARVHLFLAGIDEKFTIVEMLNFLTKNNFHAPGAEIVLSKRTNTFSGFHIWFSKEKDYEEYLCADLWPEGLIVRRFFTRFGTQRALQERLEEAVKLSD